MKKTLEVDAKRGGDLHERIAFGERNVPVKEFQFNAKEGPFQVPGPSPLSSTGARLPTQSPRGLRRFIYRMVKDRDLYGELAFAETAESLRMNVAAMRVGREDRVVCWTVRWPPARTNASEAGWNETPTDPPS